MLERRVFSVTAMAPVYPNLFILLVAPPGIGKSMVLAQSRALLAHVQFPHIAPSNMTKAGFLDVLSENLYTEVHGIDVLSYHYMQVVSSEFGVFCPAHDLEFLSVLNDLYDCPTNYREHRRSMKEQIDIKYPGVGIIAGTQPGFLANLLPPAAWEQGFMSRMIMVHSGEIVRQSLFEGNEVDTDLLSKLRKDLRSIGKLVGQFSWTKPAMATMTQWYEAGCPPRPDHFKLHNYNTRRHLHVLKLSMVSAAASRQELFVQPSDVEQAIQWLLEAEEYMPDIFNAMAGSSDHDTLRELQLYVLAEHKRTGKEVPEMQLISFLQQRTPVYNVMRMLEVAQKGGLIKRNPAKKLYSPGAGVLPKET